MNRVLIICTALLCLSFTLPAAAEMYKWVDEKGNITYSDTPPEEDAEALEPPMLNAMPSVKSSPRPAPQDKEETEEQTRYSSLQIIEPTQDATLRSNSGNISITLNLTPALNIKQGHYLSIMLNGNIVSDKLVSPTTSLSNIDRGTHILSASVKNRKGKALITSGPVTVHLHRARK